MSVFSIVQELAGNNSRLFKEGVLKQEKDFEDLKFAFYLALNPYIQFYIRKIPDYVPALKSEVTLMEAMKSLKMLFERQVTGNKAIEFLRDNILSKLDKEESKVIEWIIGKDMRCGVSEATINKVWPNHIPEYPVMLASQFSDRLIEEVTWPAMVQLKMDGMRFNVIVKDGKCEFRSRNGKLIDLLGELEDDFILLADGKDTVFDGELTVHDASGIMDRKTGNGICNKAVKGTISIDEAKMVHATLWDRISYDDFTKGRSNIPYKDRFFSIHSQILTNRIHVVEYQYVDNIGKAYSIFQDYLERGQEGIILKTLNAPWENKRSKHLIKFKGELECDLKVVDWVEGTGKNVGRLGALVLESRCSHLKVNVGTGFTDDDRNTINHGNSVGRIVSIKYNAKIIDKQSGIHSLFLPVFIEFRDDKTVADNLESIK
jgi:hypothetical protein